MSNSKYEDTTEPFVEQVEQFKKLVRVKSEDLSLLLSSDYLEEENVGKLDLYITNKAGTTEGAMELEDTLEADYEEFREKIFPEWKQSLRDEYPDAEIVEQEEFDRH